MLDYGIGGMRHDNLLLTRAFHTFANEEAAAEVQKTGDDALL